MKGIVEKNKKNDRLKELIRYGLSGLGTTIVNMGLYQILLLFLDYRISNLIAIIASKLFSYITNKLFVFHSKCGSEKELLLEIGRFILARGATGLLDYFGVMLAVDILHLDKVWSKYVVIIIVIILNYILGKKAVFTNTDGER